MRLVDDIEHRFAAIRTAEARAALAELRSRETVLEEALRLAEQAEDAERDDAALGRGKG